VPHPSLKPVESVNKHYVFNDYNFLGRAYEAKGRLPEAIEAFRHGLTFEQNTELWAGLGHAYGVTPIRDLPNMPA
jgi:hypothetical protein